MFSQLTIYPQSTQYNTRRRRGVGSSSCPSSAYPSCSRRQSIRRSAGSLGTRSLAGSASAKNHPYIQMPKSMHPPLENPLYEHFGYASGCSPYRLYAPRSEDQATSSDPATANSSTLNNATPQIVDPCWANPPVPGAPVNQNCSEHLGVYHGLPGSNRYTDRRNTTIFVGGLREEMTEDDLAYWFRGFGELYHVRKKSRQGQAGSCGFVQGETCGYVQFADRKVSEMAMAQMQGYPVWGNRLRLSWGNPET